MRYLLASAALFALCSAAWADEPATLKSAFGKWFEVGMAGHPPDLSDAEQRLLLANFTNVTPEGCMKPQPTEPAEGKYTFDKADALVAYAQQHGLKVNGHTLVWHESCPDWFFLDGAAPAGRELTLARMREHITTEVSRYRGKVASWDVVNEALSDKAGEYLRPTKWLACIGDDYIAEAFIAARKADPSVDLYYNDYSIENPVKREKALRLVRELQAKHVPIDGIGIQGHWSLDKVPYQQIEDSIAAFRALGIKVMFTELDLDVVPRRVTGGDAGQREEGASDPYAAGCPPEILQRQAEQYGRIFAIFRKHHEDISRVTFWGLHDGRSWLNTWPRKRTNYPLLWSRDLTPKPAFGTVMAQAEP